MTAHSNHSDFVRFFRSLLANPRRISAIAPSSESLAKLITKEISPSTGPILELGAGTGVFTKLLLAKGIKEEDLTLVEFDSGFAHALRLRHPKAKVIQMDATLLTQEKSFEGMEFGAIVSGLPLLSMSPHQVSAILSGAFHYLKPEGGFYQFTYLPKCPVAKLTLEKLALNTRCIGRTIYNLPPASVYCMTRSWAKIPTSIIDMNKPQSPVPHKRELLEEDNCL